MTPDAAKRNDSIYGEIVSALIDVTAAKRADEVASILEVFARRTGGRAASTPELSMSALKLVQSEWDITIAERATRQRLDALSLERSRLEADEQEVRRQQMTTEELSATGSFRWNLKTGEDVWSDNFYRLLGYEPNEIAATTEAFVERMMPDDREHLFREMEMRTQLGEPFELEFRLKLPDGTVRSCRSRGRREGTDYYVGVLIDVSELRETERKLRHTELALSRVSQRTEMGELAASIAHDLNQPLTSVAANAGAARRWLNRPVPDVKMAKESLVALIRDAKRAVGVVRSMQGNEAENLTSPLSFNLDEALNEVVLASSTTAELHDAHIVAKLETGGMMMPGAAVQFQQIVYNLIVNGLEAMDHVAKGKRVVSVRSARIDDRSIEVLVEDAGHGIAADELGRIFDSFYTTKATGMGLGLAICRSIIERMQGSIEVQSQPGVGTQFRVSLPIAGTGEPSAR